MIRTFEERWNEEYLSGVTNEVVELVSVASIQLRKRAEIPKPPGISVVHSKVLPNVDVLYCTGIQRKQDLSIIET
jgi:hypothetical protein